jgi:hypothetical protein
MSKFSYGNGERASQAVALDFWKLKDQSKIVLTLNSQRALIRARRRTASA